jgi:branched-subunit amino acid transport protein AzlD
MLSDPRALSVILAISVVTIFLRLIPFLALEKLSSSSYLQFLGEKMPTGVMVLLVAYTLKDQTVTKYPYGLPHLGALLVSVALYWKTRNSLLAIGLGLAMYMVAVNMIV